MEKLGGGIQRKLDYVIISEKKENWVRIAKAKGQADINQMYQRKIVRMEINIKLKQEKKRKKTHKLRH